MKTISSLQFLKKKDVLFAIAQFNVHFVILSSTQHDYLNWAADVSPGAVAFASEEDFLKSEYKFQNLPAV